MTDTPKTTAEMREAAARVVRRNWGHDGKTIVAKIMAIPLPADDAEMVERVARAICEADGNTATPEPGFSWGGWKEYIPEARAALSAMRGEP